jgi:hypothetical protein
LRRSRSFGASRSPLSLEGCPLLLRRAAQHLVITNATLARSCERSNGCLLMLSLVCVFQMYLLLHASAGPLPHRPTRHSFICAILRS